jgi:N-acetylglutamate synthase-like GNAT family acetyltransferase
MTMARRATAADVASITALVDAAYSPHVARIGQRPGPMLDDYDEIVATSEVWVSEDDAGLTGCLVLMRRENHLLIENVAVRPDVQGRGVGRFLLDLADARARELGLGELRLYTHVLMTENRAYYARHGYQETHVSVEDGFRRAHFARTL